MPGLWAWLDALPAQEQRPTLLRGDVAYGNESVLCEAEARDQDYLSKLKLTSNVKRLIQKLFRQERREEGGQGWEGIEDTLALSGWSRSRRVVVMRRKLTGEMLLTEKDAAQGHSPSSKARFRPRVTNTPC